MANYLYIYHQPHSHKKNRLMKTKLSFLKVFLLPGILFLIFTKQGAAQTIEQRFCGTPQENERALRDNPDAQRHRRQLKVSQHYFLVFLEHLI